MFGFVDVFCFCLFLFSEAKRRRPGILQSDRSESFCLAKDPAGRIILFSEAKRSVGAPEPHVVVGVVWALVCREY